MGYVHRYISISSEKVVPRKGVTRMIEEWPDFIELKMDAEINGYQDGFGPEEDF